MELFDLKKEGVGSNYNHIAGQGDIQIWELPRAHSTYFFSFDELCLIFFIIKRRQMSKFIDCLGS